MYITSYVFKCGGLFCIIILNGCAYQACHLRNMSESLTGMEPVTF